MLNETLQPTEGSFSVVFGLSLERYSLHGHVPSKAACRPLRIGFGISYWHSSRPSSVVPYTTAMAMSPQVWCLLLMVQYLTEHSVHSACNLVGVVVVYFFLYESSHISLENVDNVCDSSLRWSVDLSAIYVRCTPTLTANLGLPEAGPHLSSRIPKIHLKVQSRMDRSQPAQPRDVGIV
jgi:hypothetical protein